MAQKAEYPQISAKQLARLREWIEEDEILAFAKNRVDELGRILQAYLDERSGKMLEAFKQLESALLLPPYAYDLLRSIPNEKVSITEDGARDMTVIPELPHAENEADDMKHLTALRCRVHEAIAMLKVKGNPKAPQRRLCERLYQAFGVGEVPYQRRDVASVETPIEYLLYTVMDGEDIIPDRYRFSLDHARKERWLIHAHCDVRDKTISNAIDTRIKLEGVDTDNLPTAIKNDLRGAIEAQKTTVKNHAAIPSRRKGGRKQ